MKRFLILCSAVALFSLSAAAQSSSEFIDASAAATKELRARSTIASGVRLDTAIVRKVGKNMLLDLHFNGGLSDFPWTAQDVEWFRDFLDGQFPESWKEYRLGEIYCRDINIKELVNAGLRSDGLPGEYLYKARDPFAKVLPLVQKVGEPVYEKGLSGRHISLWQSHGRYYEPKLDRWEWQRAPLHRTVEDMYTQSYVLPFLIPMLENAGACVLTPRERDTQKYESVCDNDPAFAGERPALVRTQGSYSEKGAWADAGEGFADARMTYRLDENPFRMGTARQVNCVRKAGEGEASASWEADLPEDGSYAVYVSYKTVERSTSSAHYSVLHKGGKSDFIVNQKIGGGTWIYLGTFAFEKGQATVTVDNICPEGRKFERKSVLTADAVRFGGGMGKVARGLESSPLDSWSTSGMPSFAEGAMYWMQWAGVDYSVWHAYNDDYTNDYSCRGAWTQWMLSRKGVPFDLSMAFHTDAGTTKTDSTVGSLSVYTLMADGSRKTEKGLDRMSGRLIADYVQTQICNDVRENFDPQWSKRMLWDRSYSESRTTGVPGMLLELLSHQNLADMKYGLDPTFRFTVSRAVYKGMLKALSDLYGVPYTVQPLPVHAFCATFSGENVKLEWKPQEDPAEPSAAAQTYIVQTRIDDGEFDEGFRTGTTEVYVPISEGHVYSWRVIAENEGGKSFPSEILSAGKPASPCERTVLIVNNFTRISAPAWFDTPDYAGFDGKLDAGVSYGQEINYIGDCYQFRRNLPWSDDDSPGFGGTHSDHAGELVAGNSFDYPAVHGKAVLALGYAFCSSSQEAFSEGRAFDKPWAVDIICGKQVTTRIGAGKVENRFKVFPEALRNEVARMASNECNIIVSGANIATDAWDQVYPVENEEEYKAAAKEFCKTVLGYRWLTGNACYTGAFGPSRAGLEYFPGLDASTSYINEMNPDRYCVENPDGLQPADANATVALRYTGNNVPAAILYVSPYRFKSASFGFPLECVKEESALEEIFKGTFAFFGE